MLLLFGLGATASQSLPGDPLYGVSRAYERVGVLTGFVDPVEQRLHEVIALVERGDTVLAAQAAEEALTGLGHDAEPHLVMPPPPAASNTTTVPDAADQGGSDTTPTTAPPEVTEEATDEEAADDAAEDDAAEDPAVSLKLAAELLLSTVREDGTDIEAAVAGLALAVSDLGVDEEEETVTADETSTTSTTPSTTTTTEPEEATTTTEQVDSSTTTTTLPETSTTSPGDEAGDEGRGPIFLPPEF